MSSIIKGINALKNGFKIGGVGVGFKFADTIPEAGADAAGPAFSKCDWALLLANSCLPGFIDWSEDRHVSQDYKKDKVRKMRIGGDKVAFAASLAVVLLAWALLEYCAATSRPEVAYKASHGIGWEKYRRILLDVDDANPSNGADSLAECARAAIRARLETLSPEGKIYYARSECGDTDLTVKASVSQGIGMPSTGSRFYPLRFEYLERLDVKIIDTATGMEAALMSYYCPFWGRAEKSNNVDRVVHDFFAGTRPAGKTAGQDEKPQPME